MLGYPARGFADEAADNRLLKEQMRMMMQRIEDLTRQVDTLSRKQAAQVPPSAVTPPSTAPVVAKTIPAEPKLEKFLKGFYGTLDVSVEDTTKGIGGMQAYSWSLANPANPNGGFVKGGLKSGPVGRVGWMPELATNSSKIGYKGSHPIKDSGTDIVYQVEAGIGLTAAPGTRMSYTRQSNVVADGIGFGDSFLGLAGKTWGALKFGTTYAPYKRSTDRLNPFAGQLGSYSVVMGNSGGDNRVEFGTRLEHSLWYESPKFGDAFSFDVLVSPGQNRTYDNVVQPAGSSDCAGGNMPGSGNLLLRCDDGGFGNAFSADIKFEIGGFYATAAYELHKDVNRNSDGIGSNNPIYGSLIGPGTSGPNGVNLAGQAATAGLLDWGTYDTLVAEFPQYATVGGGTPGYLNDIGDEKAWKVGVQYKFGSGLTIDAMYEWLRRDIPANLEFQNERSRNGSWLAATQTIGPNATLAVGWAHAAKTVGDPGGQHNYNPLAGPNTADMYTIAFKYQIDKQLYWYVDAADTVNHGNAHFDLGAGGHGITTDCHDGTNTVYIDYSSAGPTTWGGCHIIGISTGVNYKF
jgi:predicted porin